MNVNFIYIKVGFYRQPDIRVPDMAIFGICSISGSGNCFAGYPTRYPVYCSCRIFRILSCFFSFVSVTSKYLPPASEREDFYSSFSVLAVLVFLSGSCVCVCLYPTNQNAHSMRIYSAPEARKDAHLERIGNAHFMRIFSTTPCLRKCAFQMRTQYV